MSPDAEPAGPPHGEDRDASVGELVFDVSEQISILVREEIELAKAEITEKVTDAAAAAASSGSPPGSSPAVPGDAHARASPGCSTTSSSRTTVWLGFMIEALFWFAGRRRSPAYFAYRSFQKGSPPTPDLAIEEAKLTCGRPSRATTTPYAHSTEP